MRSAGLVGLACLMVGSAGGCRRGPSEQSDANVVVVISPHNPHIRSEFSRAFAAWHELHYGEPAELRWRDVGGTGQILKFLAGEFAAARKRGQAEAGIGVDVFFGGGPAHEQARQLGLTVPVKLPPEVLAGIPAELNGVRLYHRQGYWFGTALSSFGIIYYRRGLEQLHLPPPQRWADLADPRYYGRLILADASKSGSARACYEMILQRYGWRKGLPLLLRIAANTRQFVESSSIVPREVAKGSALAGMCIDFYGYAAIDQAGAENAGFVLPAGETAITPDPISLLLGAPHRELAERFITFVLSEDGQRLWGLRAGTAGGPVKHSLYRLPIRPEIYRKYAGQLVVYSRPFERRSDFRFDESASTRRSRWLGWLFKAACVDNRRLLRRAYKAIIDADMPATMVAEWNRLPFDEARGFELGRQMARSQQDHDRITRQWYDFFRAKYQTILRMAGRR